MRAGKLRHRVTVESLTATDDAYGAPVETWVANSTRWAEVRPLQGRERWAVQQVNAEVTHEVRMRYFPGLQATMRIKHKGRVLTILAPINTDERNKELVLPCKEEVE